MQRFSAYVPGVHAARALAITMVVSAHLVGLWTNLEGFHWLPWDLYLTGISGFRVDHQAGGHAGLLLFFLVSGYIVSQAADSDRPFAFAVKRAARLLPAMVVAVMLTLAVARLGQAAVWPALIQFDSERAYSPWALVEALGIGPVFYGTAILFPLWTLAVEIYWYVLLAIAIALSPRYPVAATVGITAIIGALLVWSQPLFGFFIFGGYPYVLVILLGRWIYLRASRQAGRAATAAGFAVTFALYAATVWRSDAGTSVGLLRMNAVLWAVALFLALLTLVRKGPWRPVSFVADVSYGLYLFHIPAMWVVLPIVSPGGRFFEIGLAVTVAVTVMTAWVSYRFVETPARRAARQWLKSRLGDRPLPPAVARSPT